LPDLEAKNNTIFRNVGDIFLISNFRCLLNVVCFFWATKNENWFIIFNFNIALYKAGTNVTVIPKEQIWLQFDQQQTNFIEENKI